MFNKHPVTLLKHSIEVLLYQKTWIGYTFQYPHLPKLKPSVLGPAAVPHNQTQLNVEALLLANEWYAREYEPLYDLRSIVLNYQKLGIN